jgi:hypothetical protein
MELGKNKNHNIVFSLDKNISCGGVCCPGRDDNCFSPDDLCFCDEACELFGDCCQDAGPFPCSSGLTLLKSIRPHLCYPSPEEFLNFPKRMAASNLEELSMNKPLEPKPLEPTKHTPQPLQLTLEEQDPDGPGTKLSQMLEKIGIKSSPTCSCKARAKFMNEKGYEWCEQNIDTIVEWLKEEATKRKFPFINTAGKILVKRAISLSKRAKLK